MAHTTTVRPEPITPPTKETDEAKPHHHRMAQEQGEKYSSAVTHMAEKVAKTGAEAHAGEMIVALAVEAAEGMYQWKESGLEWMAPQDENVHIEISARDAADNRFIPGLDVRVKIFDEGGAEITGGRLPMLWHPWLYHYGSNFALSADGPVTIEVEIEAPRFPRHDEENGRRYTEDVFVRFEDVELP